MVESGYIIHGERKPRGVRHRCVVGEMRRGDIPRAFHLDVDAEFLGLMDGNARRMAAKSPLSVFWGR